MTDKKKDNDIFEFLINDKMKIRSWLLNNLPLSSVANYSLALHPALSSMDVPQNKKEEMICF